MQRCPLRQASRNVGFNAASSDRQLLVETFETRKEAAKWARDVESKIDQGLFRERREIDQTTLFDALDRYRRTVTIHKRGKVAEENRIKLLQARPFAQRSLSSLQSIGYHRPIGEPYHHFGYSHRPS